MNVEAATMTVPWREARDQFDHYRALVRQGLPDGVEPDAETHGPRATRDDVSLYKALRAMLRGKVVLDVPKAICDAPLDEQRRPKIAIARADWPFVHVRASHDWDEDGSRRLRWRFSRNEHVSGRAVRIDVNRAPHIFDNVRSDIRGRARVPLIPAAHRPKGSVAALAAYHILFEAEWEPIPPIDPILLRHIDGPFYLALAAWNLTPLEQAVLRQRV